MAVSAALRNASGFPNLIGSRRSCRQLQSIEPPALPAAEPRDRRLRDLRVVPALCLKEQSEPEIILSLSTSAED